VKRTMTTMLALLGGLVASAAAVPARAATLEATIDFEGLAEGAIVSSLSSGSGISGDAVGGSVAVVGAEGGAGPNAAMIFDATCTPGGTPADCTGDDPDLFFPAQGNVLIVSEDLDTTDPDDSATPGSTLSFDYSGFGPGTVTVVSLTVMDTEEAGGTIALTTSGNPVPTVIPIPVTGNGLSAVVPIGVSGVTSMLVTFAGSGAIDNVQLQVEEEEPGGGQGCTPGYWKQPRHLDSWVGFSPNQLYETVFGVNASFNLTLLGALQQGGGGEKALGRHAVAALLNAANDDVSFAFTTAQVIAIVQAAYATGDFETAKNRLAAQNELGCPLN
jgi:hypothetical protein